MELGLVLTFLLICHYMKAETRILVNFFIASFVCPLIRAALPQAHRGPLRKGQPIWDETVGELVVQVRARPAHPNRLGLSSYPSRE